MELGGSDPFIVLEDYDLEDVATMAVVGRIGNAGQTCIGATRFIFVGPRLKKFLAMFRAALESLRIGDLFDEETTLGPLSSEATLTLLLRQVDEAVAHGAKVLTGGKRVDCKGSFMQATILTDITPDNPAYRQEFLVPSCLSCPPGTKRKRLPSQTILHSAWAGPSTPRTSSTESGSPVGSKQAWSSSITLR
jgi:succinate-semialdehyde dehydrogenase/glutarate-semialdehyde dehydrogenase